MAYLLVCRPSPVSQKRPVCRERAGLTFNRQDMWLPVYSLRGAVGLSTQFLSNRRTPTKMRRNQDLCTVSSRPERCTSSARGAHNGRPLKETNLAPSRESAWAARTGCAHGTFPDVSGVKCCSIIRAHLKWLFQLARMPIKAATNPVQPVWCDAPTPRPESPWKYSWKRRLSRKCSWDIFECSAMAGRIPPRSSKRAIWRSMSWSATCLRETARPECVGHSTSNESPWKL